MIILKKSMLILTIMQNIVIQVLFNFKERNYVRSGRFFYTFSHND